MFTQFDWVAALRTSPILMALVVCSVVTFAAVLERALYFRRRSADPHRLLRELLTHLRGGKLDEARFTCRSWTHPFGAAALSVLERAGQSLAAVEEGLQIALSEQKLQLERNLTLIGSMAAVAPLIGLLGTVWGIMRAFHAMAASGSASPAVVAAGVAEALLTTAAGLVIAVPAVMVYNHYSRRISVMLTASENQARLLREVLQGGAAELSESRTDDAEVSRIHSLVESSRDAVPGKA